MMITNLNQTSDFSEKMQRCQDYMDSLEEERRKIQVFQRELPLCLELVSQAIEACKQQISSSAITESHFHGQSAEYSEQTSSHEGPVLEEFIPIKRDSSDDDDDDNDNDEHQSEKDKNDINNDNDMVVVEEDSSKSNDNNKACKKSDWLRSVQLWNQTPDPIPTEDVPKKVAVMEVKRNGSGGAFHPFKREKSVGTTSTSSQAVQSGGGGGGDRSVAATVGTVAAPSCSAETGGSSGGGGGGGIKKDEKDGQSQSRKQRRCWSPELHRRFLQALQQLGGSHVATPKQIRELMKVDGLTNDEVKSHLQKYRLHTRRPSHSTHNNNTQQAPQFVVVGGIWVPPPPEYAAAMPTTTTEPSANAIYAPIAAPPPQRQQKHQQKNQVHTNNNVVHSNSPTTSSSDTTTASPSRY